MKQDAASTLADDIIEGIAKIAEYGGWTKRRAHYLAEKRLIPVFKVGRLWCASKSGLKAHFANLATNATGSVAANKDKAGSDDAGI